MFLLFLMWLLENFKVHTLVAFVAYIPLLLTVLTRLRKLSRYINIYQQPFLEDKGKLEVIRSAIPLVTNDKT